MNENKGNGKGNYRNDGDPTGNPKGVEVPKPQPDGENLDGCSDDDLADFKARKSLSLSLLLHLTS